MNAAPPTTPPVPRQHIGRMYTLGMPVHVYRRGDTLEIDELDYMEIRRRRIHLKEVQAITRHRIYGTAFMILVGLFTFAAAALAAVIYTDLRGSDAVLPAIFAATGGLLILLRLTMGVDIITVYGAKTQAQMSFWFRKDRCAELYNQLTADIQRLQSEHAPER